MKNEKMKNKTSELTGTFHQAYLNLSFVKSEIL